MTFARTTAWRVTARHTMTLIHGVATCTIAARMHACEATDREREEWRRRPRSARGGRAVSKPVRNSEREQRERCAESCLLFLSLARPSRRFQLLRRDSLLARRNFFSRSKASRGNTPSRSNSFSERAKRRVKINYKCFPVAIFMRQRISDVFAMKIATVCVVRGEVSRRSQTEDI